MTNSSGDRSAETGGHATLVVGRTLPQDVGTRQVYLELDGERVATLLHNDTFTRAISPGHHVLRFDNTLQKKTTEFVAAPGERVEFRFANAGGRFMIPFLAVIGVAPLFLRIERVESQPTKVAAPVRNEVTWKPK